MEDLPDDIKLQIFSRLRTADSLRCKLVCKAWETLLSRKKVGLLFLIASAWERNAQLFYGDYDEIRMHSTGAGSDNFSYKRLPKFNHPLMNKREFRRPLVGSCNGLVCFAVPHRRVMDPVYICNPVSGEYFNLPRIKSKKGLIVSGFGYHGSTNKYKVVRIHYPQRFLYSDPPCTGLVDIYTLGDGSTGWRSIGETNFTIPYEGILMNGCLHWMDSIEDKIVTFDLADEKFRVLPTTAPCFDHDEPSHYQLKMLGGHLCVCHLLLRCKRMDIWSYKIDKHNKNCDASKDVGNEFWSWSLEFSIPCLITSQFDYYEPFLLTDNDELLMLYNGTTLYRYDAKTNISNEITSVDERLVNFDVIPHINSLVSLRALGVDSRKRIKEIREPGTKSDLTRSARLTQPSATFTAK